ncbi:MAG: FHA domain-containing protein [Coriobacteriia bacterium]|nr:FHA domain-containing protein [Coriobacteriia bacterium]MCL2746489.1 FHA domain-containing protein [Coriobacteriia bacterium]MCL2870797.1 FHA domain-containing protein [Coriobacteriia bacterium]
MIDVLLFAGRILLIALLYIFLLFAIKAGVGLVRSGSRSKKGAQLSIVITQGPSSLLGTTMPINSSIVIGRAPGSDIFVPDDLISGKHARITPIPDGAIIEDLGSTNGTLLNGLPVTIPENLIAGDKISIGMLVLEVDGR